MEKFLNLIKFVYNNRTLIAKIWTLRIIAYIVNETRKETIIDFIDFQQISDSINTENTNK